MTPLIEILLAVATYYQDSSDPHRDPVGMLSGDYDAWTKALEDAVEQGYVRRNAPVAPHWTTWELTMNGRRMLFNALKDA